MKTKLLILLTMLFACVLQVKAAVEIFGSTSEVTVGTGTSSTRNEGLVSYYKNSSSQTLYLANELGHSGTIKEIAYYVNSITAKEFTGRIKIYMAETDKTNLTSDNRITSKAGMTLVYDSGEGKYTGPTGTGWETFILDNPYIYYGRNLIVVTEVSKTDFNESLYYAAYTSGSNLSIVKRNDLNASYGDAFNTTAYNSANRLNTRFKIAEYKSVSVTPNNAGSTSGGNRAVGFGTFYAANASQTLYLASEIGQSGLISQMAFEFQSCAGTTPGTVKVYMAETENTTLTKSNMFTSASQMTCVFDGEVVLGKNTNGWEVLNFTTPFYYSGKKNLVVAVSTTRETENNNFFKISSVNGRLIKSNTSSDVFGNTLEAYGNVPKIRFAFNENSIVDEGYKNSSFYLGFTSQQKKVASQSLYLSSEVGKSGLIGNLAFKVFYSSAEKIQHPVKIWMAEVPQTTLTKSNRLEIKDMTPVFDGYVELGGKANGDWIGVNLTTSFPYTGMGSLVVAISQSQDATSNNYSMVDSKSSRSIYTTVTSDLDEASDSYITNASYLPNIRFSFEIHDCGTSYTTNGFGICKNCQKELLNEFQKPAEAGSAYGDLAIANVGNLMWVSKNVGNGSMTPVGLWLKADIDLSGYSWIPIGNDAHPMTSSFYGYEYGKSSSGGYTISGLSSNNSLVGTLSGGNLYCQRLTSGNFVNKGVSGTIGQCLTLGSALLKSGNATIKNSYFLSNTSTGNGRTAKQMGSGQVTYELNSFYSYSVSKLTWRQNLEGGNIDAYPMSSKTSNMVYQYTQCPSTTKYTNDASLDGAELGHRLVNTVCSNCNAQPTIIYESISLNYNRTYVRTVDAQMAEGKTLTYERKYDGVNPKRWEPLCVPFSMEYTAEDSRKFDIAEIQGYGPMEDTNEDGVINSSDEKKLIMRCLPVGTKTKPNTAYAIRPLTVETISFQSCDGKIYAKDVNGQTFETMKEQIVVKPNYSTREISSPDKKLYWGDLCTVRNLPVFTFEWVATPSYKNGTTPWDQDLIETFVHGFGINIVDDRSTDFTNNCEMIVDKLTYTRKFTDERELHNWQASYLPFDLVVKKSNKEYPKYATIERIESEGEEEVVYLNVIKPNELKKDTAVINAHTPFFVCVDNLEDLVYEQSFAKLESAINNVTNSMDYTLFLFSDKHDYFFKGVFQATKPAESMWYGLSRFDGTFHEATGATLPPYRFYMTIDDANFAGEIRFAFRESKESQTGINNVDIDLEYDAIYTLDGRKVQEESLQPGIYIKNGKKISIMK